MLRWTTAALLVGLAGCQLLGDIEDRKLAGAGAVAAASSGATSSASSGSSTSTTSTSGNGGADGGTSSSGGSGVGGNLDPPGPCAADGGAENEYAAAVLADCPTGYWRLEEPAGAPGAEITVIDASGHGAHGLTKATLGVPGAFQGSLAATIEDTARVLIPTGLEAMGKTAMTIELWANPVGIDTTDYQDLFNKTGYPDGLRTGPALYVGGPDDFGIGFELWSKQVPAAARDVDPLVPGKWSHVVAVHDGFKISLYIDSQLEAEGAGVLDDTSTELDAAWGYKFDGTIDELAVYDRALTPARVAEHYLAGKALQ
jgi:hypothetical protein